MKKNKNNPNNGFIYSTNPEFDFRQEEEQLETLLPQNQKLKIRLETKHRAGKKATLIDNFIGNNTDMEELSKKIKNHCGCGGGILDNEIYIQGDHCQKVKLFLQSLGYKTNNI